MCSSIRENFSSQSLCRGSLPTLSFCQSSHLTIPLLLVLFKILLNCQQGAQVNKGSFLRRQKHYFCSSGISFSIRSTGTPGLFALGVAFCVTPKPGGFQSSLRHKNWLGDFGPIPPSLCLSALSTSSDCCGWRKQELEGILSIFAALSCV